MLNNLQIDRAGELLVQFKLLSMGIDTANLTTDSGIDLVAYLPNTKKALTIQVKTNLKPQIGGGKGSLSLGWYLKENSSADLVALVDLESESIWMFKHLDFVNVAQQKASGKLHFYMYLDDDVKVRSKALQSRFSAYLLRNKAEELFEIKLDQVKRCDKTLDKFDDKCVKITEIEMTKRIVEKFLQSFDSKKEAISHINSLRGTKYQANKFSDWKKGNSKLPFRILEIMRIKVLKNKISTKEAKYFIELLCLSTK